MNENLQALKTIADEYAVTAAMETSFDPTSPESLKASRAAGSAAHILAMGASFVAEAAATNALLEEAFGTNADALEMLLSTNDED